METDTAFGPRKAPVSQLRGVAPRAWQALQAELDARKDSDFRAYIPRGPPPRALDIEIYGLMQR